MDYIRRGWSRIREEHLLSEENLCCVKHSKINPWKHSTCETQMVTQWQVQKSIQGKKTSWLDIKVDILQVWKITEEVREADTKFDLSCNWESAKHLTAITREVKHFSLRPVRPISTYAFSGRTAATPFLNYWGNRWRWLVACISKSLTSQQRQENYLLTLIENIDYRKGENRLNT